jgi:hypothetical protein
VFSITAKNKPKWHNLRWKISNALVKLARKIYPRNPEVDAFMLQIISDQIIYGRSMVRISPEDIFKTENGGENNEQ